MTCKLLSVGSGPGSLLLPNIW